MEHTTTDLAFDPGYGNCKLFGPDGATIMPSLVATDGHGEIHDSAMTNRRPPLDISIGSHEFYVGKGAHGWGRPVESLDFDRFVGSPEMQALLYGVLSLAHLHEGQEINMIVGLPLALLSGDIVDVRRIVRAVKRFFSGDHVWTSGGERCSVSISSVSVASQAVGSLFDYLLTDDGRMTPSRKIHHEREIGICNVGFNTVDLLVAQKGSVSQRFTSHDTRGVRRFLELSDRDGLYSLGELDEQFRASKLEDDQALDVWKTEVMGFIEDAWGTLFRRFVVVYCVGGGATVLRDALRSRFGNKFVVADDPIISTARGLYKFLRMKAG